MLIVIAVRILSCILSMNLDPTILYADCDSSEDSKLYSKYKEVAKSVQFHFFVIWQNFNQKTPFLQPVYNLTMMSD
jgi:hypothetical protein